MTKFQKATAKQAEEIATAMELLAQNRSHFTLPQVTIALLKGNDADRPLHETPEYSQVYRLTKFWRSKGFVVRQPRRQGPPDNAYLFSIAVGLNLSKEVRKLAAQNNRGKAAPPLFVPIPKATTPAFGSPPEPEILNGLPYIPTAELRGYLGRVIEALEVLKESIPPVLTLLLDLDRDFDRFNKVKESLDRLKDQIKLL